MLGISHLDGVTRCTTETIGGTGRVHGGGRVTEIPEYGTLVVMVYYPVALEHHPAFEFPGWMSLGLLRVLFGTETKKVTQICFGASLSGFMRDIVPLAYDGLVPNVFRTKPVPFHLHGGTRSRRGAKFGFVDRASNARVDGQRSILELWTVRVIDLLAGHRRCAGGVKGRAARNGHGSLHCGISVPSIPWRDTCVLSSFRGRVCWLRRQRFFGMCCGAIRDGRFGITRGAWAPVRGRRCIRERR